MFFLHFVSTTLQILMFTLIAGFVLGFFGQEFKLAKTPQMEGSSGATDLKKEP